MTKNIKKKSWMRWVVLFKKGNLVYSTYERHYSMVRRKALEIVKRLKDEMEDEDIYIAISGSAGLGLVKENNIPFVQEVYATSELVKELAPQTNVVIELLSGMNLILMLQRMIIVVKLMKICLLS